MKRKLPFLIVLFLSQCVWASNFTVTSTAATGPGSLREAVSAANGNLGADAIQFNIPGAGPHVVDCDFSFLYYIDVDESLLIDGFTQPGSTPGDPMIVLEGGYDYYGFKLNASNIEIRGLRFIHFAEASAKVDVNEFLGPPEYHNISIHDNVYDVGGALYCRVVSGRLSSVEIYGNSFLGNGFMIFAEAGATGGTTSTFDSLRIAGNHCTIDSGNFTGAFLRLSGTGTDVLHLTNLAFEDNVMHAFPTAEFMHGLDADLGGTDDARMQMTDISIRGNSFSGKPTVTSYGVHMNVGTVGAAQAEIQYVAIDSNTFDSLSYAIMLRNIGGDDLLPAILGDISVIGNSMGHSIYDAITIYGGSAISRPQVHDIVVSGNEIFQGKGNGILMDFSYVQGSTTGGMGEFNNIQITHNHVHHNTFAGVHIADDDDAFLNLVPAIYGIVFSQNSIHNNGFMGIAMDRWRTSLNMTCYLPIPSLSVVTGTSIPYTANGSLTGLPNTDYRLEFFSNSQLDNTLFGEGETYVGSTTVTTNAAGIANFAYSVPTADLWTHFVSATATHLATSNTGCFSNAITAGPVSTQPENTSESAQIYPNPIADRWLNIAFEGKLKALQISESNGRIMPAQPFQPNANGGKLDASALQSGIYFLQLETTEGRYSSKVVVLR